MTRLAVDVSSSSWSKLLLREPAAVFGVGMKGEGLAEVGCET